MADEFARLGQVQLALAGAGLVGEGRMVLFYAAYATVAVLLENIFGTLWGRPTVDFFTVGITCIGFFAIAQVARLLALRVSAAEVSRQVRQIQQEAAAFRETVTMTIIGVLIAAAFALVLTWLLVRELRRDMAAAILRRVDAASKPAAAAQ